jgi:fucose 4-O-acetylase-like acetyltransferase
MPATTPPRVHLFDLTRGILILLMLLGHSVYFIHTGYNSLLTGLNGLADIVCFSGLVFVSGQVSYAAYVHLTHPTRVRIKKILRRLVMYALSYFVLVYVLNLITTGNLNPVPVLTLSVLFPFTEFILPLILLGLLQIPLAPLYKRIVASLPATLVVGILLTSLERGQVSSLLLNHLWVLKPHW